LKPDARALLLPFVSFFLGTKMEVWFIQYILCHSKFGIKTKSIWPYCYPSNIILLHRATCYSLSYTCQQPCCR
jgi:hypothetical protein